MPAQRTANILGRWLGGSPGSRALLAVLAGTSLLAPSCGRKSHPPNVVLISIDTLRPDHLGCYGYGRPTSPTLDSLAACGVQFLRATAQSSWTLPSHVSLFSSTHPFTHGVVDDNSRIPADLPMMAQILGSHGYLCWGTVSSFYVGRTFGFERGFDEFEDHGSDIHQQVFEGHKVLAETVTDDGQRWIRKAREPFFLFLHYYDPHVNYVVPEPYRSLFEEPYEGPEILYHSYEHYKNHPFNSSEQAHLLAQYDAAIAYVDANIRNLLETLEREGLSERTLVMITSDHGEEFFERGSWGHAHTLYREVLDVPLIVVDPRRRLSGARVHEYVRLVDVLPTLLDALGLPPADGVQGRSFWPMVSGESPEAWDPLLFAETSRHNINLTSLTKETVKLIANLRDNEQELYDLEGDREERINLSLADTTVARRLLDESFRIGAGLIPGRLCIRWLTGTGAHRYSGAVRSTGTLIQVDYRGEEDEAPAVAHDRHSLAFSSHRAGELRLALVPVDASVTLELRIDGEPAPEKVYVGGTSLQIREPALVFSGVVRTPELLEPPPDRGSGFYVWKDPGERSAAEPVDLSEEAKEHLRSLGYLH